MRESGLSFDNQESISGLAGIGGPVFNHTGTVIAAFALTGNPETMARRRDDIIEAVRFTSREVSTQLGLAG